MDKQTVTLRSGACELQLILPDFFEIQPLYKIRRAFNFMRDEPETNKDAHKQLIAFFAEWEKYPLVQFNAGGCLVRFLKIKKLFERY